MNVKILVGVAGVYNGCGFAFSAGEKVDIPDRLAESLIKAGHAEPAVKISNKPKTRRRPATKVKNGDDK